MFYPGETVRLLRDVPEAALIKGAELQVARVLDDGQGNAVGVEVEHYSGGSPHTATLPLEALEPVLSSATEQRTAVLWGLEKPPSEFMQAAIGSLQDSGLAMSAGRNVARLYYDRHELWWKRENPFPAADSLDLEAIPRNWDGCVLGFSGHERFHLEFRFKGRREAAVLLHEREEAYMKQAHHATPATELARVLTNLYYALGAHCCAFPVAYPWLTDEDWPSLLLAPHYPDLFLLPGETPRNFPSPFRVASLAEERIMVTTLPVKLLPHGGPPEPGERDGKLAALRKAHALAEKYYAQLYEARGSTAGIYSDLKDAFLDAIAAANALGLKEESAALEGRLEHVKAVYRSQF